MRALRLDGVNDGFAGTAPDLGAHEYGQPPPTHYGPRAASQPPLAPGALAATVVSSTRVDLRWADQSNSESGFRIERVRRRAAVRAARDGGAERGDLQRSHA